MSKKLKFDQELIDYLISRGLNREYALWICSQHSSRKLLACGFHENARSSIARLQELPSFSQENNHDTALGLFLLMQTGWDARRNNLSHLIVNFALKVLNSDTETRETKWYALNCASLSLHLDEIQARKLFYQNGFQIWYEQPPGVVELHHNLTISSELPLSSSITKLPSLTYDDGSEVIDVQGILLPRDNSRPSSLKTIVNYPPTSCMNLKALSKALYTSNEFTPICLKGAPGSGKTWTIHELAKLCNRELIELQMDEEMDSKTLLSSMTCIGEKFVWVAGSLTRAIHEGKWVLIEDIDSSCPEEVITSLKPLFSSGKLNLRYGVLEAHSNFRLFVTSRKENFKNDLFHFVPIEPLKNEEIIMIARSQFSKIRESVVSFVIRMYFDHCEIEKNISPSQQIRDLFKWFSRIDVFCNDFSSDFLTEKQKINILSEGVDILTTRTSIVSDRLAIARDLAIRSGLNPAVGDGLINSHRGSFSYDNKVWKIGRVSLQGSPNAATSQFAMTTVALKTLEQIATCVYLNEPCLLVGETGAGKTSLISLVAKCLGKKLISQNMHVQSDSTELIGGFKPLPSLRKKASDIYSNFLRLFHSSFDAAENDKFLTALVGYYETGKWKKFCKALETACIKYDDMAKSSNKKLKSDHDEDWKKFGLEIQIFKKSTEIKDLFTFEEGALVKALKNGDWILLDEINLATGETLERLLPLLESTTSSLNLTERGDSYEVPRHPDFRLFAAMNPSTDFGKKNLPPNFRCRFSEFYVEEISEETDIRLICDKFLGQDSKTFVEPCVQLFIQAKEMSKTVLVDGQGQAGPRYSLRTLVRTLDSARWLSTKQRFGMKRSLFESFCAHFSTSLDQKSSQLIVTEISKAILGIDKSQFPPPSKDNQGGDNRILCAESYWLDIGKEEIMEDPKFVLTKHVNSKLKLLSRACSLKKYPILLQGPTSAGKTSLIAHLARMTGNKFVRINNHEHTDLQEYLGSYVSDENGKLIFQYGALVEALQNGYWVVLDELNLAPTEVLEALNRLLDDNRELFLTETQEIIVPHVNFMLFATQNPPGGSYGGRKQLSRAFRNRFLEIHLDDIPSSELQEILQKRNSLPSSFTSAMVKVMEELQILRSQSQLFAGKQGLITPRDLMRWADRDPRSYEELAEQGYRLLGERLRSVEERLQVQTVIEKFCKAKLSFDYSSPLDESLVWTSSMKRLFTLVEACALKQEPCLIVGETGLGKTTCVDAVARKHQNRLVVLNCHQNTETADIIGSLRPVRGRAEALQRLKEIENNELFKEEYALLSKKVNSIFEWADGPLVSAMRNGEFFLLDEISLAEDAVLERLNSVLEPGRSITLAERGGKIVEEIVAKDSFRAFATMNPGGDFGKRELSPALRNRFTEIWLPSISNPNDFQMVIAKILQTFKECNELSSEMVKFWQFAQERNILVTMRDFIAWAEFIKFTSKGDNVWEMFMHGCYLTILDGLGVSSTSLISKEKLFQDCAETFPIILNIEVGELVDNETLFGISPFLFEKREIVQNISFEFSARTTRWNLLRVLRALQLDRAILLEGSPGVGKTSLIDSLAKALGRKLVRVNLSEQTDFSDLIGSDLPNENGGFEWIDGVLLKAIKNGDWVLLDELNLASQTVLEGLNSILDHRKEIFVPELNKTFSCSSVDFRLFASQNPISQGGGRKGLPKSFLNRFTKVFVDPLTEEDFHQIGNKVFPNLKNDLPFLINLTSRLRNEPSLSNSGEFNLRDVFRSCQLLNDGYDKNTIFDLLYFNRFGIDKEVCKNIYCGMSETNSLRVNFEIDIKENVVKFGNNCTLERKRSCTDTWTRAPKAEDDYLVRLAISVRRSWPVLCIDCDFRLKELASLLGRGLKIFQVTSATDATELLGCFEQVSEDDNKGIVLSSLLENLKSTSVDLEYLQRTEKACGQIHRVLQDLLVGLKRTDLEEIFKEGISLLESKEAANQLEKEWNTPVGSGFKWQDGLLIQAIQRGDWIVLQDANLCSPQVLDRLNSLLEDNCDELMVNEQGSRVVQKHPDFRIFLTMSSEGPMISRAMRNRCVEIYIPVEEGALNDLLILEENGMNFNILRSDGKIDQAILDAKFGVNVGAPFNTLYDSKPRIFSPSSLSLLDFERERFRRRTLLISRIFIQYLESMSNVEVEVRRFLNGETLASDELTSDELLRAVNMPLTSSALSVFLPLIRRLTTTEKEWFSTVMLGGKNDFIANLIRVGLFQSDKKFQRVLENSTSEHNCKLRFFKETLESLDLWLESIGDGHQDITEARNDFWRVSKDEEVNICWRKLLKLILNDVSNANESNPSWKHFINCAKRFDVTLKFPYFERQNESTLTRLWKHGGHPQPPTDALSLEFRTELVHLNFKSEDDKTKVLQALTTLRFTGCGGGFEGKQDEMIRDTVISAMKQLIAKQTFEGEAWNSEPSPVAKRVVGLYQIRVAEKVAKISLGKGNIIKLLPGLVKDCEKILSISLKTNCVKLSDLAKYQELLWCSQDPSDLNGFIEHCRVLIHELLVDLNLFENTITYDVVQAVKKRITLKKRFEEISSLEDQVLYPLKYFDDSIAGMQSDWNLFESLLSLTRTHLENENLVEIVKNCLNRCKEVLSSRTELGVGFALIGLVRYMCFCPRSALDPHCKHRVLTHVMQRRKTILEYELGAIKLNHQFATVLSSDGRKYSYLSEVESLEKKISELESKLHNQRSGVSIEREQKFDGFFKEMQNFQGSIGNPTRLLGLIQNLMLKQASKEECLQAIEILDVFSNRLEEEYFICCDFVYPLRSSFNMIKHGIYLLMKQNGDDMPRLLTDLLSWPRCHSVGNLPFSNKLGPKFNSQSILASLSSWNLELSENRDQFDHTMLRKCFSVLTEHWRFDRKETERRRIEKEALVQMKKSEKTEEEIEKEKEDTELKSMFPDFHSDFQIVDEDQMDEIPEEQGQKEDEEISSFENLNKDQVHFLVDSFISLYADSNNKTNSNKLRLQTLQRNFEAASTLVNTVGRDGIHGDTTIDTAITASNVFVVMKTLNELKL